jgi:hypothetical protein
MPAPQQLAKAELRQLDSDFKTEIEPSSWTTVQFNPETLKVTYANQIAQPGGTGDNNGGAAMQFVGAGTTKLAVQLWFDVTSQPGLTGGADDVRQLTKKISFFITPKAPPAGQSKPKDAKAVAPVVRFLWGSFQFDGVMESLEESLELFSPEGKPLRASVAFGLTQQKILKLQLRDAGPLGAPMAGTVPMTPAPAGQTLQAMVGGAGLGLSWQAVAQANGIENPRLLRPGQLINLNVDASASLG